MEQKWVSVGAEFGHDETADWNNPSLTPYARDCPVTALGTDAADTGQKSPKLGRFPPQRPSLG
jgi:hypothetical protein